MKFLRLFAVLFILAITCTIAVAQNKAGSQVLTQQGNEENPAKNSPYSYESIRDVTNVDKAEMFKRVKNWIITSLKVSSDNVVYDESNDLISVNAGLLLPDIGTIATRQTVSMKIVFNFKEGKMRTKASDFTYASINSLMGVVNQTAFHQLPKTLSKKDHRKIYEQFDAAFELLVNNAFGAANGANNDKW